MLTLPEEIDNSSLFGTLNFIPLDSSASQISNESQFKPDDDDYVFIETSNIKSNQFDRILSPLPIPISPKKKLLWQLEYKSVPYYVRFYNNQLFVCDKYGEIQSNL
jgi:hypothetical protein